MDMKIELREVDWTDIAELTRIVEWRVDRRVLAGRIDCADAADYVQDVLAMLWKNRRKWRDVPLSLALHRSFSNVARGEYVHCNRRESRDALWARRRMARENAEWWQSRVDADAAAEERRNALAEIGAL